MIIAWQVCWCGYAQFQGSPCNRRPRLGSIEASTGAGLIHVCVVTETSTESVTPILWNCMGLSSRGQPGSSKVRSYLAEVRAAQHTANMASSINMQSSLTTRAQTVKTLSRPARVAGRQRQVAAQALATSIVISGATAASLALGRFVFLPFQRDNVSRQGLGEQHTLFKVKVLVRRTPSGECVTA